MVGHTGRYDQETELAVAALKMLRLQVQEGAQIRMFGDGDSGGHINNVWTRFALCETFIASFYTPLQSPSTGY